MMKSLMVLLVTGLLATSSAHATALSGQYVYIGVYHFTQTAFDKEVKSVMVHTGVSVKTGCGSSTEPYWDNVQDVMMTSKGYGFFAEAKLTTSASECKSGYKPVVQYWVTFADGSELKTAPAEIPVRDRKYAGYDPKARESKEQEARAENTSAAMGDDTHAIMVDESFAD